MIQNAGERILKPVRLKPEHAAQYRAIMLEAYAESDAFTSTVAEREPLPLGWWRSRLSVQPDPEALVFGVFADGRLAGVAGLGLRQRERERTRHKSTLFGMFVRPESRHLGIGRMLVEAVLDQARKTPGTRLVQLTVTRENVRARRLYESCGFVAFGTEPFANRLDERYVALVHMWCPVDPGMS